MTRREIAPTTAGSDFEQIEAAVMETARGRWFLGEFARRNRSADTNAVMLALKRVEALIRRRPPAAPVPAVTASPGPPDIEALAGEVAAALQLLRDSEARLRATFPEGLPSLGLDSPSPVQKSLALQGSAATRLTHALARLGRKPPVVRIEPPAVAQAKPVPVAEAAPPPAPSIQEPPLVVSVAAIGPPAPAAVEAIVPPRALPEPAPMPMVREEVVARPTVQPIAAQAAPAERPAPVPADPPMPPAVAAQLDALLSRLMRPEGDALALPAPAVARAAPTVFLRPPTPPAAGAIEDPTANMSRGEKLALFS